MPNAPAWDMMRTGNLKIRGEVTLRNLVLCAFVLDDTDSFLDLFSRKKWQSIDEIMKAKEVKKRKRGSRNE